MQIKRKESRTLFDLQHSMAMGYTRGAVGARRATYISQHSAAVYGTIYRILQARLSPGRRADRDSRLEATGHRS
jgi:hypothetical protein